MVLQIIMINLPDADNQFLCITNFQDLVSTPFDGAINAICWARILTGDFAEIVEKIMINEYLAVLQEEQLCELQLGEQGQLAREILLNDLKLLTAHGASPILVGVHQTLHA